MVLMGLSNRPINAILNSFVINAVPSLVESIVLPIALFMLAFELKPSRPAGKMVKWGLITGTMYIVVFWLLNSGMWVLTVMQKGTRYLTSYPQNLLTFILTVFGLLALAIYTGYLAKKSSQAESLRQLNLKIIGAIVTALGMYFLWNYLSWIFFGGNYLWSDWYAWFFGHNLDLWMLSLPLLGLPLLFSNKLFKETV
jgi:thiamine transporter ThiT